VIFVLFLGIPGVLVDVFTPFHDDGVFAASRELSIFMIRIAALYVFANGIMVVFAGALRGAGDTFWCMIFMVLMHWVLVSGLYLAISVLHLGPRIGWTVLVVLFLGFPFVLWHRWRSGKWEGLIVSGSSLAGVVVAEEGFREGRDG